MGKLLAIVGVVALLFGLAVYEGWFGLSATNDANRVEITIDKTKIKEDTHAATEKVEALGRTAEDDAQQAASNVKESVSSK